MSIRNVIVAAALMAAAGHAFAADLPMKAKQSPALQFSNGYDGNGFYFGLIAQGGAGSVQGSAPGVQGGLTSTYGNVGGLVGYNFTISQNTYGFVEYDITYQNLSGSSGFGLSFSGPLSMDIVAAVGAPLDQVAAFFPSLLPSGVAFPSLPLPNGVTAKNIHPYIGFDGHIYDASSSLGLSRGQEWIFQPGVAIGMLTQYSNNAVIDSRISVFGQGNSFCFGPADCVQPGTTVIGSIALRF